MKRSFLGLLLCLVFSLPAAAETSVWTVEKDGVRAYLGGTSHLLRPSDYPLPPEYDAAYTASDAVVFEVNPGLIGGPEFQREVTARAFYPEGKGLDQVLSEATFRRLAEEAAKVGIDREGLRRMKPGMVALILLSAELNRLGVTQKGVDLHFYEQAVSDHKPVLALETPEEQVGFVFAMGEGEEEKFVHYMLQDIDRTGGMIESMIEAWKSGDAAALDRLALAEMRQDFPAIYRTLIVERNERWLKRIEELIASPPTEMILVGGAHLVGKDGLIEELESRGYRVEKVP